MKKRSRLQRAVRAAACVAVWVTLAAPPVAGNDVASSGIRVVGSVPFPHPAAGNDPTQPNGAIVLDSENRLGYRIADVEGAATIKSFNLDTLREVASGNIGATVARTSSFLVSSPGVVGGGRLFLADSVGAVWVLNGRTLEVVDTFPGPMPSTPSADAKGRTRTPLGAEVVRTAALAYVPGSAGATGKLLVLSEPILTGAEVPERPVVFGLSQWDARSGQEEWATRTDACRSGRGSGQVPLYGSRLAISSPPDRPGVRDVILACLGRQRTGEIWRIELSPMAAQPLASQTLVGLVPAAKDFYIDAAGRRAIVATEGGAGQSFVGVDVDRRGAYGIVQASLAGNKSSILLPTAVSAGLDPVTGRLYSFAAPSELPTEGKRLDGGLAVVDARRSPMPQGLQFPDLNPERRGGSAAIAVDPARGDKPARVFVRYGVASANSRAADEITVIEDTVPVQTDIPLGAADRFTVNVPERPGLTRASLNGSASAYGARAIAVGGLSAANDSVAGSDGDTVGRGFVDLLVTNRCAQRNREASLASVAKETGLSDSGMSAASSALATDPSVPPDAAAPVASCQETGLLRNGVKAPPLHDLIAGSIDDSLGRSWGFSAAVCSTGESDEAPHENDTLGDGLPPPDEFRATAECSADGTKLRATAQAGAARLSNLKVQSTTTVVDVQRLEKGGIEVRVQSVAEGISAPGFSITRVTATAVSRAAGRKGTASTDFKRLWCGITTSNTSVSGCINPDERADVVSALNTVLNLRDYRIEAPVLDEELRAGTPGGALAAVQKNRFASLGDRLFNNDVSTAVPAMQIIHTHDARSGRGRQVYQFAGVEASTAYNISLQLTGDGVANREPLGGADEGLPSIVPSQHEGGGAIIVPSERDDTPLSLGRRMRAIVEGIRYLLRDPLSLLSAVALVFTAFALPLHFLDRRRAVRGLMANGEV